ncbi:hypothetical protein [Paenibacillus sp. Pae108]|uniref:hypothetical protein n=1 Tax=Paenibacillus sp. Pae108 TaxID=2926019 RepID=UPI0021192412|nr:hypothetical protein [Paenibacillus sp. Pae108]
MSCSEYDGIEKKVALWIEGKSCRIGLIVPDRKPTEEEIIDLHRTIAEIAIRSELRRLREKEETNGNDEAATQM